MVEKIRLVQTCGACPEQYDVYFDDVALGYLRLRFGRFTADYPDCDGETVYEASTRGVGVFDKDERDYHLRWALYHLLVRHEMGPQPKPEAPPVKYTVEGLQDSDDDGDWPF